MESVSQFIKNSFHFARGTLHCCQSSPPTPARARPSHGQKKSGSRLLSGWAFRGDRSCSTQPSEVWEIPCIECLLFFHIWENTGNYVNVNLS